jgi:hypothetical protein
MPRIVFLCLLVGLSCLLAVPVTALAQETDPLTEHGLTTEEVPGALVGPWFPVKVGAIVATPGGFAGKRVELAGEYRGLTPGKFSALLGKPRRLDTDWILGDETGEIYVANRPEAEFGVALHPEYRLRKRVVIRGTVRVTDAGVAYVDPALIRKRLGDRGAYCSLEVMSPDAWRDGAIGLRIILKNDTSRTLDLLYPAGLTHDIVVSRNGAEVWRWSRHGWLGQGIGSDRVRPHPDLEPTVREFLPPDNSRIYVDYWPQVDNSGDPAPLGQYQVQGIISRRIWTYPVTIEAGYPPDVIEAMRADDEAPAQ